MAKKQNRTLHSVQTVGLDIGYGVTKAVNLGDSVLFPSVFARAVDAKFETAATGANYRGDDITDSEGDWIVGEKAQKHGTVLLMLRGRSADEESIGHQYRVRLMKAALGKLYPGIRNGEALHFHIATGLPVDHMRGAAAFKRALVGQHPIKTDQTDFVANIVDVSVMPQPYGTIYRQMLTETGKLNPCHTATRTGVVDVGTYTIDITLDDDGEYIDDESGSVEAGVYRIQQAVENDYERRFSQKPHYKDIETIIRSGCVRVSGHLENFTEVINPAVADLAAVTINKMQRLWEAGAAVDVIYVSGGGAALVIDQIKRVYKQAELTEEAQLANAQGYLNYANFKALEG